MLSKPWYPTIGLTNPDRAFCAEVWAPSPSSQDFDLTTVWYCVDMWNAPWSDHHVVLSWLVECTMIWLLVECTMIWLLCVGWWNDPWSDYHVVLCCLMECTMILSPCGTVLTGGMHDDLTAMWYCTESWNARWSDHHVCWLICVDWRWSDYLVVLCWLMGRTLRFWVWLQHSNECDLLHLTTADIPRQQWTCAIKTCFGGGGVPKRKLDGNTKQNKKLTQNEHHTIVSKQLRHRENEHLIEQQPRISRLAPLLRLNLQLFSRSLPFDINFVVPEIRQIFSNFSNSYGSFLLLAKEPLEKLWIGA